MLCGTPCTEASWKGQDEICDNGPQVPPRSYNSSRGTSPPSPIPSRASQWSTKILFNWGNPTGTRKTASTASTTAASASEENQATAATSNITTEVIAETSETVEIEGADPTQDEEEIDDDEDAAELENNADTNLAKQPIEEKASTPGTGCSVSECVF